MSETVLVRLVLSSCALLTVFVGLGFAQAVNNAGVSGQVVDPTGGTVAGATVKMTETEKGVPIRLRPTPTVVTNKRHSTIRDGIDRALHFKKFSYVRTLSLSGTSALAAVCNEAVLLTGSYLSIRDA